MPKSKKSYEERIADLEKKQAELKEEKKKLIAQHKKDERKKDAHNKILLGATVLSVLGRSYIDGDEKRLMDFLAKQERNGKYFTSAMNRNLPIPETTSEHSYAETDHNDSDSFNK